MIKQVYEVQVGRFHQIVDTLEEAEELERQYKDFVDIKSQSTPDPLVNAIYNDPDTPIERWRY